MSQPKNKRPFQVAIIGGGIAGLTLAISLHHRAIPVTIYEQASAFGEVGAGLSFGPNAVQAMKLCHEGIHAAFEKVCTRNLWPEKQHVWFDYLDGYSQGTGNSNSNSTTRNNHPDIAFTISNGIGQTGVHRAHFLDELINLIPSDIAQFNKRLENIIQREGDGKLTMQFTDGDQQDADLVIGCDGIKSRVRQILLGSHHPAANPSYTHKYAYRGLIPMKKAVEAVGEELAENSYMHMGPDGHILTFPVNQGTTLNIVAFHTSSSPWTLYPRLTRDGTREEALCDFAGYGPNVLNLLKLTDEKLSVWAIFDLHDHPVSTFSRGRICISGDAAHATSPHHGAGAGFCIEDAAVLARMLGHERVKTVQDLEAVGKTFDRVRRQRTQWLVRSSRFIGDCYEWRAEGVGRDFGRIEHEINARNRIIGDVDVEEMCRSAVGELEGRLRRGKGYRI